MTDKASVDALKPCPFFIGDKVQIISPLLKDEWANSECYIVGNNLKGDNFDRYDFSIKEVGVRGITDGWGIHDLKCIERREASRQHFAEQPTTTPAQGEVERVAEAIAKELEQLNLDAIDNKEQTQPVEISLAKAAIAAMQPAPVVDENELLDVMASAANSAIPEPLPAGYGCTRAMMRCALKAAKPYLAQSVKPISLEDCVRAYKDADDFLDVKIKAVLDAAGVKYTAANEGD